MRYNQVNQQLDELDALKRAAGAIAQKVGGVIPGKIGDKLVQKGTKLNINSQAKIDSDNFYKGFVKYMASQQIEEPTLNDVNDYLTRYSPFSKDVNTILSAAAKKSNIDDKGSTEKSDLEAADVKKTNTGNAATGAATGTKTQELNNEFKTLMGEFTKSLDEMEKRTTDLNDKKQDFFTAIDSLVNELNSNASVIDDVDDKEKYNTLTDELKEIDQTQPLKAILKHVATLYATYYKPLKEKYDLSKIDKKLADLNNSITKEYTAYSEQEDAVNKVVEKIKEFLEQHEDYESSFKTLTRKKVKDKKQLKYIFKDAGLQISVESILKYKNILKENSLNFRILINEDRTSAKIVFLENLSREQLKTLFFNVSLQHLKLKTAGGLSEPSTNAPEATPQQTNKNQQQTQQQAAKPTGNQNNSPANNSEKVTDEDIQEQLLQKIDDAVKFSHSKNFQKIYTDIKQLRNDKKIWKDTTGNEDITKKKIAWGAVLNSLLK